MLKKYGDFIAGLCGLAFSVLLFINAMQISLKEAKDFGAGFLPKLVAIGLFICCAILTYRGYVAMRTVEVEESAYKHNYVGAIGIFIMMVVYSIALKPVGFVIASFLFMFSAILLATKKEQWRPVYFAVITIIVVLAVYFVFTKIFGIRIPNGLLSSIF